MSGINKRDIRARLEALKQECANLQTLIAQYDAAIAELEQLLQPKPAAVATKKLQPVEYIEASE